MVGRLYNEKWDGDINGVRLSKILTILTLA